MCVFESVLINKFPFLSFLFSNSLKSLLKICIFPTEVIPLKKKFLTSGNTRQDNSDWFSEEVSHSFIKSALYFPKNCGNSDYHIYVIQIYIYAYIHLYIHTYTNYIFHFFSGYLL